MAYLRGYKAAGSVYPDQSICPYGWHLCWSWEGEDYELTFYPWEQNQRRAWKRGRARAIKNAVRRTLNG